MVGDYTTVQACFEADSYMTSNFSTVPPLVENRFGVVVPYPAMMFLREPGLAVPPRVKSVADRPLS